MRTEQEWIPLSGAGSRLPTEADGNDEGFVWTLFSDASVGYTEIKHLNIGPRPTHFCPIAKRPPLPKPVDLNQEDKDQQKANQIIRTNSTGRLDVDIMDGIQYGRADGRRQLAAECLALFGPVSIEGTIDALEACNCFRASMAVRSLHKLLTEAAK